MRFKAIPEAPESIDELERAWRAVPLVPEGEGSCCRRLADRLDGVDVDDARIWLGFLRALDLVTSGETGYTRRRRFPEMSKLEGRFRDRVFGVEELLEYLQTAGDADPATAFEAVRASVPTWERHHQPTSWESVWRDRVAAVLDWCVLFGLCEVDDGVYELGPNVIGDRGV